MEHNCFCLGGDAPASLCSAAIRLHFFVQMARGRLMIKTSCQRWRVAAGITTVCGASSTLMTLLQPEPPPSQVSFSGDGFQEVKRRQLSPAIQAASVMLIKRLKRRLWHAASVSCFQPLPWERSSPPPPPPRPPGAAWCSVESSGGKQGEFLLIRNFTLWKWKGIFTPTDP